MNLFRFGWEMGFEPTTLGTTIRYSNQLSYTHHLDLRLQKYYIFPKLRHFLSKFFIFSFFGAKSRVKSVFLAAQKRVANGREADTEPIP